MREGKAGRGEGKGGEGKGGGEGTDDRLAPAAPPRYSRGRPLGLFLAD